MPPRFSSYEDLIRRSGESDDTAADILLAVIRDIDSRLSLSEDLAAGAAAIEKELTEYGHQQIATAILPIVSALRAAASLGAILTAASVSAIPVALGVKTLVIVEGDRPMFAPPAMLVAVANDNPSCVMWGRRASYNGTTGELVLEVLSVSGSGTFSSWTISAGAMVDLAAQVKAVPSGAFVGLNVQDLLGELMSAVGGNPHFAATISGAITAAANAARAGALADTQAAIAAVVNGAGPALDTLKELQDALGNDPSFAATIAAALAKRVRVDAAQGFSDAEAGRARANIGAGVLAGHRDVIINGDFNVWQRGTSVTLIGGGSGSFIADRWRHGGNYSQATVTVSRQAFAPGQVAVPGNPTYYLRYDRSVSGSFNTTVEHRIEGVKTFAASVATATLYVKGTVGKVINLIITQNFGSGGAPSPSVVAASREVALTSVWQRVDLVADIPSVAGKTLGGNANDYLVLTFDMPAAAGAVTLDIAHVSFVPGDASAEEDPKPPRHVQLDEALCYRYYYRVDGWFGGHGVRYNTAGPIRDAGSLVFPAEMRAVPTALMLTSVVYENCSAAVWDALWKTGANLRVIVTATGIYRALGGAHAFDAEL